MPINNLPAGVQDAIQQGYLEREFRDALRAKLGFRDIADREAFAAGIGETLTKTRFGLLPAVTTPDLPASNTDLTSGVTTYAQPNEQYTLTLQSYSGSIPLNLVTSRVAVASIFLQNVKALAEQAARSLDQLAMLTLYGAYLGGRTHVITTLTAAGTSVHVDDITGFAFPPTGKANPSPVAPSNALTVTINGDGYSCIGAIADAMNVSSRITFGGVSGTLTFSGNVSTADGTLGNSVVSSLASLALLPNNRTSAYNLQPGDYLTMYQVLGAKEQLAANGVMPVASSGRYRCYGTGLQFQGLYRDPVFQSFFRGRSDTPEYRRGVIADQLGVEIVETNIVPIQVGGTAGNPSVPVYRAIVCGQGALIEADFTEAGYAGLDEAGVDRENITVVDGIAHITREPLDAKQQVVTQTWNAITSWCAPTDTVTNPLNLPTASNASYKRAAVLVSF